ncbi:Rop family plasmid primer RNA-binding protein [Salmonella enterica subsp. enterica]|nr:Rop family plasmid primer RNA-binding protein [Salmonella enterica subsp. enterica]
MTKQESAALNMAKFIRAQSLLLLEKLDVLDLDDEAADCERMHEPRQPGGCKLKTAPVRPVVAARPAEYVCSEDLFY